MRLLLRVLTLLATVALAYGQTTPLNTNVVKFGSDHIVNYPMDFWTANAAAIAAAVPGVTSITGTANQVIVTGSGAVTLSLPQNIGTNSNVNFGNISTSGNVALSGHLRWENSTLLFPFANGSLRISNFNQDNFGLLQLGGLTSAFPAIKRSGAGIQIRLADDSAFAALTAGSGTFASTVFMPGLQFGDGGTAGTTYGFIAPVADGVFRFGDSAGGGSPSLLLGSNGDSLGVRLKRSTESPDDGGLVVRNGDNTDYARLHAGSIRLTHIGAQVSSSVSWDAAVDADGYTMFVGGANPDAGWQLFNQNTETSPIKVFDDNSIAFAGSLTFNNDQPIMAKDSEGTTHPFARLSSSDQFNIDEDQMGVFFGGIVFGANEIVSQVGSNYAALSGGVLGAGKSRIKLGDGTYYAEFGLNSSGTVDDHGLPAGTWGLSTPTNLPFVISTGAGGERIRVTNLGKVGIGTISPSQKLDVVGTIKSGDGTNYGTLEGASGRSAVTIGDGSLAAEFAWNNTGSTDAFGMPAHTWGIASPHSSPFLIYTTHVISLASGSGQSIYFTPSSGAVNVLGNINVGENPSGTSKNLQLQYNLGSDFGYIQAIHNGTAFTPLKLNPGGGEVSSGSSGFAVANGDYVPGTSGSYAHWGPWGATTGDVPSYLQAYMGGATAYAAYLINPQGGSVGIGTTTQPRSKLEVVSGNLNANADTPGVAATFVGTVNAADAESSIVSIESNDTIAAGVGGVLGFGGRYGVGGNQYANWANIKGLRDDAVNINYGGYLSFGTRANGQQVAERMRISSTGQVSIGTSVGGHKFLVAAANGDGMQVTNLTDSSLNINPVGGGQVRIGTDVTGRWFSLAPGDGTFDALDIRDGFLAAHTSLVIDGFTNKSSIKAGSIEVQAYGAVNNAWIGENIYYSGSAWVYRATGAANKISFGSGAIQFDVDTSGSAGGTVTNNTVLTMTPTSVASAVPMTISTRPVPALVEWSGTAAAWPVGTILYKAGYTSSVVNDTLSKSLFTYTSGQVWKVEAEFDMPEGGNNGYILSASHPNSTVTGKQTFSFGGSPGDSNFVDDWNGVNSGAAHGFMHGAQYVVATGSGTFAFQGIPDGYPSGTDTLYLNFSFTATRLK